MRIGFIRKVTVPTTVANARSFVPPFWICAEIIIEKLQSIRKK